MKTTALTIRFRGTSFDITVDEDGLIDSIEHNGNDVTGLMFDLNLTGEIQTEAMTALAEHEMEAAQLAVEAAMEQGELPNFLRA
jgi:hypothetical protein